MNPMNSMNPKINENTNPVWVSGATGLLGSHIIEQGLKKKYNLGAFVRDRIHKNYIDSVKDQIDFFILDLLNPSFFQSDIAENIVLETIIHSAAFSSSKSEDAELIWKVNFEGTKNLFEFALKRGLKKWVQISSVSTICDGVSNVVREIDESFHGKCRPTEYAKSKYETDLWLEQKCKENGIKLLTLFPCYMLGSYDSRPSSGAILFALKLKKIKFYINNIKNFVSARDVAIGLWKALESEEEGKFILGNENIEINLFLKKVCYEMGISFDLCSLDKDLLIGDIFLKKHEISENELNFIKEFCFSSAVSSKKAMRAFNYCPTESFESFLEETINWFSEKKMLKPKKFLKAKTSELE